jgi:hypothetical protein
VPPFPNHKDSEKLDKTHKDLDSKFSTLTKSHEQHQIQLAKNDMLSSSTPCDHTNVIEENTRLKAKLTKSFPPQGDKNLDDLLSNERSNNGKGGLGFGSKSNKKNKNKKKKKARPAQRIMLWVVMSLETIPPIITLRETLTLIMCYFVITMEICLC